VQTAPAGGRQTFTTQDLLRQSAPVLQALPTPQTGQPAPQSVSVSAPLVTPSEQLGAWQMPETHTPLWQSLAEKQLARSAHFVAQTPPQSTSDSVAFRTRSEQEGAWHRDPVQTELAQSAAPRQSFPGAHSGQAPPQSASDSVPLMTPSLHVAAAQVPVAEQ
jgi:hypothetical protein